MSGLCQTSKMKRFAQKLTAKSQILYVWQSPKYASEVGYKATNKVTF